MRPVAIILLVSLAYVGCAHKAPAGAVQPPPPPAGQAAQPPPPPESRPSPPLEAPPLESETEGTDAQREPRFGGVVRFVVTDRTAERAVIRSNVAEPVAEGGMLLSIAVPRPRRECWVFELNGRGVFPDGTPVRSTDVIDEWQRRLADPWTDTRWLLDSVCSAEARCPDPDEDRVQARGDRTIEICPRTPTPDLPRRLAHPASWYWRDSAIPTVPEGPGPFESGPNRTLLPNRSFAGDGPYLDRVEPLQAEGDPTLLLKLGDAHLGVAFGAEAQALLADASSNLELERLPAWDRTYFLWLNPARRWVNDPYFRRWLAGRIDRTEMVDYLFEARGERAFSLSGRWASPVYDLYPNRPLSPMSEPRLELAYEQSDPYAETVARRVDAVLGTQGIQVTLVSLDREEIRTRLAAGAVDLALLAHRPATSDPVLALLGTVWWLGPEAGDALARLKQASEIPLDRDTLRRIEAEQAEKLLLKDARVVPLVRVHAWLVRHPQLAGVVPGVDGVLRLEESWWRP